MALALLRTSANEPAPAESTFYLDHPLSQAVVLSIINSGARERNARLQAELKLNPYAYPKWYVEIRTQVMFRDREGIFLRVQSRIVARDGGGLVLIHPVEETAVVRFGVEDVRLIEGIMGTACRMQGYNTLSARVIQRESRSLFT